MNFISLGYNAVPAGAEKAILGVLRSGQFSPGSRVKEFEEKFAKLHNAKYAVFVNSGTDALRLSLLAMKEKYKWQDSDEVAVPAVTFVATVNTILQANLEPFFVDVGMYDYCINPHNFERRVQGTHTRLVAMVPVHLFGQSCGQEIFDIAKKYKLKVLEDSCETIGNPLRGDISCFSTYMAHHVTTGVGGLALTNDARLDVLIRSYANHGRDPLYLPGHQVLEMRMEGNFKTNILKARFRFERVGYSSRATEFEAALGLAQLEDLRESVSQRQIIFHLTRNALEGFSELTLPTETETHTAMMFPIVLKETSKVDKYDLCLHLEKNGIETRDMMPITNQPCYKEIIREDDFPVAKWINKNGFYVPCNQGMTQQDIEQIRDAFTSYFK